MPVVGYQQVAANLRAMGNAVTPAVRKRARQKALKPIQKTAIDRLGQSNNVETRALITSVIVTEGDRKNESIVGIKRGRRGRMNRNPVRYAHLVEYGTAPHWQPNRFGGIMHPGARPFPFMRPALEVNRDDAVKAYFTEVWSAVAAKGKR